VNGEGRVTSSGQAGSRSARDPHLLNEGDPSLDPRAFRRALGQFGTGVAVITAAAQDELVGTTVNSFASVSLEPPLVLWSLRKESRSLAKFLSASHFAVNVLASHQVELSAHFARSGLEKFGACDWRPGAGGAPLFEGVAAQFECRREGEHDGGDHVILVGLVEYYRAFDRAGLLFAQGRYALALDLPGSPAGDMRLEEDGHPRDDFFLPLLVRAYAYLSESFQEHRDAEGLSINQSRVLAFLATRPGASVDVIARLTLLGVATVEDAIAKLLSAGFVAPRPPGAIAITAEGLERLARITRRARQFETDEFSGLDPKDVEAARRVLRYLASRDGS
jgi:flavin reductase (DIM6/NTAB) family NADH-FMN oxidoreductase RutF/DNA-binding MarR family transcriptional regulator